MKLWYLSYHGPSFTKLNPGYKNGWTIGILKQGDDNQLFFDKVIKSPDSLDHRRFKSGFWAGTMSTQAIERDPHNVIKWLFEEFKK